MEKGAARGINHLHPRFFDLRAEFLTCNEGIRRHLRRLTWEPSLYLPRHLVVSGPQGCGKATLAIQAWKKMTGSRLPIFGLYGEYLNSEKELIAHLRRAKGCGLLIRNLEKLPEKVRVRFPQLIANASDVRVLATTRSFRSLGENLGVFQKHLSIPPLEHRPEDIRLIISTLLWKRGHFTCTSEAMEVFLTVRWPGEFSELADCVMQSLWRAREHGRSYIDKTDVLAVRGEAAGLDFWFLEHFLGSPFRYRIEQQGLRNFLREFEAVVIASGLLETCGNLTRTAQHFRVPVNTLIGRCKSLGTLLSEAQTMLTSKIDSAGPR